LRLVDVNLATVAIEGLLFGAFLVTAVAALYLHLIRASSLKSTDGLFSFRAYFTPVIISSLCITLTVTAHWILTVDRLFDALIRFEGGKEPLAFYSNLSEPTEIAKTAFLIATLIVSDVLFIYRLWTVWSYNYYIIAIPSCAILGLCVAGPGIVYQLSRVSSQPVFENQLNHWISADYSFTFITNVYSSVGIAWKVWRASKGAKATYGGGSLMRVIVVMVESAAIYTSYVVFFFVCYQAGSNLQYIAVDTLCPVAGIAFMLINVRVGMGWAQQARSPSHPSPYIGRLPARHKSDRSPPVCPVAVDITQVVQREDDKG
ncbi:hypothetical protein WOLCODRAFT_58976, partial [Wolfiporia cocos MD-104 SS10]